MSEVEQALGRYPADYYVDIAGPSRFRLENKETGNVEFAGTISAAVHQDHQWERALWATRQDQWERGFENRGFVLDY